MQYQEVTPPQLHNKMKLWSVLDKPPNLILRLTSKTPQGGRFIVKNAKLNTIWGQDVVIAHTVYLELLNEAKNTNEFNMQSD
jgi:hypothetical protein